MVAQCGAGRDNPNPRIRAEFVGGRKTFVVKIETNAHILPRNRDISEAFIYQEDNL
jgi:hypothetical protein